MVGYTSTKGKKMIEILLCLLALVVVVIGVVLGLYFRTHSTEEEDEQHECDAHYNDRDWT